MKTLLTLLWLEWRDCPLSRPVPSPQANGLHHEGRAGCPNAKVKPGLGLKQLEQRLEWEQVG